jgi:hypothetical protein
MPQIIFNPEEAEFFANDLDSQLAQMYQKLVAAKSGLETLRHTFKDGRYEVLAKSFEESTIELLAFMDECEQYSRHLRKKAHRGREYLERGGRS